MAPLCGTHTKSTTMIRGVMDFVFSVCIVTRAAVGAHVWEV